MGVNNANVPLILSFFVRSVARAAQLHVLKMKREGKTETTQTTTTTDSKESKESKQTEQTTETKTQTEETETENTDEKISEDDHVGFVFGVGMLNKALEEARDTLDKGLQTQLDEALGQWAAVRERMFPKAIEKQ